MEYDVEFTINGEKYVFHQDQIINWSFCAGFVLFGAVETFLDECKFMHNMDIEWHKTSGWFQKTYFVRGKASDIADIANALHRHSN